MNELAKLVGQIVGDNAPATPNNHPTQVIAQLIRKHGTMSIADLAARMKRSTETIREHVKNRPDMFSCVTNRKVSRHCMVSLRKSLNASQPVPKKSKLPDICPMVIEDLEERSKIGAKKYGTSLKPRNGRDSLLDAYQEALDLAQYLRQAIWERDNMEATGRRAGASTTK